MRKFALTLFAWMAYVTVYCGVPQAISYQAVALDAYGSPIKDKTVGLRLSILAGSATGTVDYQERQTPTTDGSGVMSIAIGEGSVLSGSFASINWSTGVYFLKTEMDTTGGTNYTTIGTVQFFSVPYAQYAASSGLGSIDYPDGLTGITPINLNGSFSYIVPAGQTLYVTDLTHNTSTSCTTYGVAINGVFLTSTDPHSNLLSTGTDTNTTSTLDYPIGIPSGYAVNSVSCGSSLLGFTMPTGYSWVVFDLSTGDYTVPVGKVLVLKNMVASIGTSWNGYYTVGSNTSSFTKHVNFIDQGQTVSASGLTGSLLMMGYLKNR